MADAEKMAKKAKVRRPRPHTVKISVPALVEAWTDLAKEREVCCPFSWDGNAYNGKLKAGDETSMVKYAKPLLALVKAAPTGFPDHGGLVDVFETLDDKFKILEVDQRFRARAAALASEQWRMMTKHLYEWAVQGFVSIYCEISDLVDLIQLPQLQPPNPAAMQPHEVRGLFPNTDAMDEEEEESHNGECISDVSTSEVEFCGAKCNCLDCNPAHGLQTDTSLRAQEKKDNLQTGKSPPAEKKDNLQTGKSPPAEKKTTCRPTSRPQHKKDNLQTDKSLPADKKDNLQTDKSPPAPKKGQPADRQEARAQVMPASASDLLAFLDRVPSALKGGQKRETLAVKLRIRGKQKPATTKPQAPKKKKTKKKREKRAVEDQTLSLPVVFKVKPATDEAFLEHNVRTKCRVIGITKVRHENHKAVVQELCDLCNDGTVTTVLAARAWLERCCSKKYKNEKSE